MKLDVLAFEAHPDDVELTCAGTLAKLKKQGYKVGVIALTRAELGTRGDSNTRLAEFRASAQELQLDIWGVLDIPDGSIELSPENRHKLIRVVREYRPELVLCPYWEDRHPDHANASRLVKEALFQAGLVKVKTGQEPHRPKTVVYYPLYFEFTPSLVVDVSETFEIKLRAIRCYRSQFHTEGEEFDQAPATILSSPDFLDFIISRARYWGAKIGVTYGEPFLWHGPVPVDDLVRTFQHLTELR